MKPEPRPLQHMRDAERDYGRDLWKRHTALVEDVRSDGVTWPPYIHAPLAAAYAIASGGGERRLSPDRASDVGRALRWAREHGESESQGGTHASPVGHVRRAHWHTYWLGSEDRGDRRRELRWLAPILVSVDLPEELLAVVRRVKRD